MTHPAAYKPSPLSFGSPRASPFRRPESPSSPSTAFRSSTPPTYQSTRPATSSRLQTPSGPNPDGTWMPSSQFLQSIMPQEATNADVAAISSHSPMSSNASRQERQSHERDGTLSSAREITDMPPNAALSSMSAHHNVDALSKLHPAQVREMREAFQILDRNSDGLVDREDVGEMLTSLGLDGSPSSTSTYFPPLTPHLLPLPAFLSSLSSLLAPLSPPSELLAALDAFDDDDSGQIDTHELIDALLHTAPEPGDNRKPLNQKEIERVMEGFVGRRAFKKHGGGGGLGSGEIFRYREWVAGLGAVDEGEAGKVQAAV